MLRAIVSRHCKISEEAGEKDLTRILLTVFMIDYRLKLKVGVMFQISAFHKESHVLLALLPR